MDNNTSCAHNHSCTNPFSCIGNGLAFLVLRLFLAYEFFEAGLMKWQGNNWFAQIQEQFFWPFSAFSADVNWYLSMGAELLIPILFVLGLFVRFGSLVLLIVTIVAWAAVHAGNGYNVCDNGYKMALMYIVMLLPLLLQGGGSWSVDHVLKKRFPSLWHL